MEITVKSCEILRTIINEKFDLELQSGLSEPGAGGGDVPLRFWNIGKPYLNREGGRDR